MDELKKPLGQKPQKAEKTISSKSTLTTYSVVAALCLASAAFAFVTYDRLYPSGTTSETAKPEIVFNDNQTVLRDTPKPITKSEPKPVEKLVEIKPDGDLTTPKVRPTPSPRVIGQELGTNHIPEKELSEKGGTGLIPKMSADGKRPMDVYAREPDTQGNFGVARVVIILASMGISQSSSQQAIKELPAGITLAFAPYGNSLKRWMQGARKKGHELLLQLPMEPIGQANPGPHTLTTTASAGENITNLHWSMSRITNYVGVMNFLGGKITADVEALKPIFDDLSERGLLFVDDGSTGKSKTEIAAAMSVLPYTKADIQIDTIRTRSEIQKQLKALSEKAKRTGLAIGVANAFPDTIKLLVDYAKTAQESGIEITPVSAIVKDPQKNR